MNIRIDDFEIYVQHWKGSDIKLIIDYESDYGDVTSTYLELDELKEFIIYMENIKNGDY